MTIRALLDANVLISAAMRPLGTPGQLVVAFLSRQAFELVLSPSILVEAQRALTQARIRKYLRDPKNAQLWLLDLAALADMVEDTGNVTGVCRDADDDMVLAAAVEGRADAIVTGDQDLLVLEAYEGIAIVSPRVFLDSLAG